MSGDATAFRAVEPPLRAALGKQFLAVGAEPEALVLPLNLVVQVHEELQAVRPFLDGQPLPFELVVELETDRRDPDSAWQFRFERAVQPLLGEAGGHDGASDWRQLV